MVSEIYVQVKQDQYYCVLIGNAIWKMFYCCGCCGNAKAVVNNNKRKPIVVERTYCCRK